MNATVLSLTPSENPQDAPEGPKRLDVRPDLKAMTRAELGDWVVTVLGEPRFRADQIFRWIHLRGVRDFAGMSDLSRGLRERLTAEARLGGLELEEVKVARDGTRKLLLRTPQGDRIESVLIPMDDRITQCVSSQVGCKIGCDFCLTARMPLRRHLSASEIVDQVLWARRVLGESADSLPAGRVSNLVYMGMGEPLDNYDNVMKSLRIISDEFGVSISTRRITVSTSGVVPKLERLAKEDIQPNLAISLNASNDIQRDRVIPINKAWNISRLLETLRAFPLPPRRLITIEYVMLAGFNDTLDDARRLATLLRGLRCKVNLIPFNPWPGANYDRPTPAAVDAFGRYLLSRQYTVTVRYSKGDDIGAACGQLDGKQEQAAVASV
jgi:23S rRNA (adenine2503-C2)-methyltransferase